MFTHILKSSCLPYIFYTFVFFLIYISILPPALFLPKTKRIPSIHPVTVSYSDDDFDETSDSEGDAALLAAQGGRRMCLKTGWVVPKNPQKWAVM